MTTNYIKINTNVPQMEQDVLFDFHLTPEVILIFISMSTLQLNILRTLQMF